jgi:carbamoyl-phosphate synthase large subunit
VHVFNSVADSSAFWQADAAVVSPSANDPRYPVFLEEYCLKHQIRAVLSCMDVDLDILAGLKEKFARLGITVIVADLWVTKMALDKWMTHAFLVKHQLPTVPIYFEPAHAMAAINKGEVQFPLFVKPRWGMGSIALRKAENGEELDFYFRKTKQIIAATYLENVIPAEEEKTVLIQPQLEGQEYGLDVINDLNGHHMVTVVKRKLAMRAGETDRAITVLHPQLEQLGAMISNLTKHPGNLDMDVFWDGKHAYILECNPRFGGGYPFSHVAGVNLPKAIVSWLQNATVSKEALLTPKYGVEAIKGISLIVKK